MGETEDVEAGLETSGGRHGLEALAFPAAVVDQDDVAENPRKVVFNPSRATVDDGEIGLEGVFDEPFDLGDVGELHRILDELRCAAEAHGLAPSGISGRGVLADAVLAFEDQHVAGGEAGKMPFEGCPVAAGGQDVLGGAPGVEMHLRVVALEDGVVHRLEDHHAFVGGPIMIFRALDDESRGAGARGEDGGSRRQPDRPAAGAPPGPGEIDAHPGAGVGAFAQGGVEETDVAADGDSLPRRGEVGLGRHGVLVIAQVVGGVGQGFDDRHPEIGGIALVPAGDEACHRLEHELTEGGVILGQVIDFRILRRQGGTRR